MRPAAIVLAAGRAERFGGGKLEARLAGKPLIEHLLDTLLELPLAKVVGVVRPEAESVAEAFRARKFQVEVLPSRAQADSIRRGVLASREADGYLLLLGDQPFVGAREIEAVVEAWQGGSPAVFSDGGRGPQPPALFDASLWEELLELQGDQGAKMLAGKLQDVALVRHAPGLWMEDVDSPEALERLERELRGAGGA